MNEPQFAVTTVDYDAYRPRTFETQMKRRMSFKEAAAYAATAITNPGNISWCSDALPRWFDIRLAVRETKTGASWVELHHDGEIVYFPDYVFGEDGYSITMYLVVAMQNAVNEIRQESRREMTPSEIETELGLSRGVVRKYIHGHKVRLLEVGVIRRADGRTWLCKRGWALHVWGK